jgi:tRNA dimethylallyltransferase
VSDSEKLVFVTVYPNHCSVQQASQSKPPVLLIAGPTASGKTTLAVELVRRFPFAIVSVDSALVYKGMDIGTAKPDAAILRIAPHRLIDIRDPSETYSAAQFCIDARAAIEQIRNDGRLPLLVGGTMLYFRALQQGLTALPSADLSVRARLAKELAECGSVVLHARLGRIDPKAAMRIHRKDSQRILRALEVHELTGRTATELYESGRTERLASTTLKLALVPKDRLWLHQRIEQRLLRMLEEGFVTEVASLHARRDLSLDKPAMRAVGYRQVWQYLEGLTSYSEMVQRAVAATRQFAKRQLTWLRAEREAVWLDSSAPGVLNEVIEHLYLKGILPMPRDRLDYH